MQLQACGVPVDAMAKLVPLKSLSAWTRLSTGLAGVPLVVGAGARVFS